MTGRNPSGFGHPTRPVESLSWHDVQAFLDRINARVPGLNLCLPSEAQWEYACRAGTATALYTGGIEILGERSAPALDPIAWYAGNSVEGFELEQGVDSSGWPNKQYPHQKAGTRPVDLKAPNAWGILDMLGNVWEWCADDWNPNYDGAPNDGRAWIEADTQVGAYRALRGGSWEGLARLVRSACREGEAQDIRGDGMSFRLARVREGAEPPAS